MIVSMAPPRDIMEEKKRNLYCAHCGHFVTKEALILGSIGLRCKYWWSNNFSCCQRTRFFRYYSLIQTYST